MIRKELPSSRGLFPFTAIVGQQMMKRALIFNAIDPSIGGVLITGTRGTAKSTAVRSLAALLSYIEVINGDPFNSPPDPNNCDKAIHIPTPFVNLPIGATEDNVLGTLDIERALKTGERHFEPGLLARANRGVLYVDEVNLLPDHLVDVLLDAVAMGINRIEREGVSFEHEARVILVGTMNPEEGELRPQLLDRFGLCVKVDGYLEPNERKEVIRRRIAFDSNAETFTAQWKESEHSLQSRIELARTMLGNVQVSEDRLDEIAQLCADAKVDGLRADIVIYKTACAIAAFAGRNEVISSDVEEASLLALAHRRAPTQSGSSSPPMTKPPNRSPQNQTPPGTTQNNSRSSASENRENLAQSDQSQEETKHFSIGQGLNVALTRNRRFTRTISGSMHGKRAPASSLDRRGAFIRAILPRTGEPLDLALSATLRAAALDISHRRVADSDRLEVLTRHLRIKQRRTRTRNLLIFVVDASGSMAAQARMRAAKGAVCALLEEAYQKRDYVALIAFHGDTAEELLPPTRSAIFAYRRLDSLPTGGRTPLAAGLKQARCLIERQRRKDANIHPFIVLVTDGRATMPEQGALEAAFAEAEYLKDQAVESLTIDTETGWLRLEQTRLIAERLEASYRHISDLPPKSWSQVVREWVATSQRTSLETAL
ncbi:MAG: VWA domain-containing protein [Acidobacteriota bacterium]